MCFDDNFWMLELVPTTHQASLVLPRSPLTTLRCGRSEYYSGDWVWVKGDGGGGGKVV